ncbi:MAG TPA: pitrilysin family protein [Pyrinomonadaceae bacterium]|jgi:predicted Zn-dependent peptidase
MKRLAIKFTTAVLLVAALGAIALAQQARTGQTNTSSNQNQSRSNVSQTFQLPRTPVEQFTLKNGLRVILSEDHAVPVVSVAVYYDTGSRNEKQGRTGFAHLFEHMMFQGSENVPKAAHFQFISNAGGTMNGTTSSERTNYFETLPANQLPLALWLESDRMRSLKVTQENLDNQRKAVQEEKRLRVDNQPYVPAFLRIDELIFKNPANSHSTIGSMEDLDAATVEDVQEFFRIYYAPNNAVLTIVGDFDSKEARSLVEKYFGSIPRQPAPPAVDVSEPTEVAQRQESFYDRFAPLPGFMLAWKIPARRTQDYYPIALASSLLAEGESSRLYQKLVKGEESVVQIQSNIDERRGPSAAFIFAIPKPGKEIAQIRQAIMAEIKKLATDGPTAEEMEKLHNNLRNDAVRARQSSLFRAQRLAEFALYDGDPNLFNTELDRYLSVTPAQIKEAAARYLDTDNRVMMEIVPGRGAEKPAATAQPSGVSTQPGAPAPQVPAKPEAQPASTPTQAIKPPMAQPAQPQQPADAPKQTEPGAQPKRP